MNKKASAAQKREELKRIDRFSLRGLSHQQIGSRQRGFKGSKLGAASAGRTLSAAERAAIEAQMRAEGKL